MGRGGKGGRVGWGGREGRGDKGEGEEQREEEKSSTMDFHSSPLPDAHICLHLHVHSKHVHMV